MANVFALAPAKSVNKGFALDYQPIYPEVINILQQAREDNRFKAAQQSETNKANLKWWDGQPEDEGLDVYDTNITHDNWQKLDETFYQGYSKGQDMVTNPEFNAQVNEVIKDGRLRQKATDQRKHMAKESTPDGELWWFDRSKLANAVKSETDRAREAGEIPNYDAVLENKTLYNRGELRKRWAKPHMGETVTKINRVKDEAGEDVARLDEIINSDIYVRYPEGHRDAGEIVWVDGNPMVQEQLPANMITDIAVNHDKYYEALLEESKITGQPWDEIAYNDYLQEHRASDVKTKSFKYFPDDSTLSAGQREENRYRELYKDIALGFTENASPSRRSWSQSMLRQKGMSIEKHPDKQVLVVKINKTFIDSGGLERLVQAGQDSDVELSAEMIDAIVGGKQLGSADVKVAEINLRDGVLPATLEAINMAGLIPNKFLPTTVDAREELLTEYGEGFFGYPEPEDGFQQLRLPGQVGDFQYMRPDNKKKLGLQLGPVKN